MRRLASRFLLGTAAQIALGCGSAVDSGPPDLGDRDGSIGGDAPDAAAADAADGAPTAVTRATYEVTATLTAGKLEPREEFLCGDLSSTLPASWTFRLSFPAPADGAGGRAAAVVGGDGWSAVVRGASSSADEWTSTDPTAIGVPGGERVDLRQSLCAQEGTLAALRVRVDGAGGLMGTIAGSIKVARGDVVCDLPFSGPVRGKLETGVALVTARAFVPLGTPDAAPWHPLSPPAIVLDRPLAPGGRLALVSEAGHRVGLTAVAAGMAVAVARFTAEGSLTFGATYQLVTEAPFVDPAGRPTTIQAVPLTMIPALAATSRHDFEGPLVTPAILATEVKSSDAAGLPAISGARSLHVDITGAWDAGGRVTARLQVPAGGAALRLRFRRVVRTDATGAPLIEGGVAVELALDRGGTRRAVTWPPSPAAAAFVEKVGSLLLGPIEELTVPLPADAAPDVHLDLTPPRWSAARCGRMFAGVGILMDDLRVE